MKTAEEILKKYSVSSVDAATSELTYREGLVLMAMEEYASQLKTESGMVSLAEVEKFIWEIGEDYHLWDEKEQGEYPVKRTLTAIQKWFTAITKT